MHVENLAGALPGEAFPTVKTTCHSPLLIYFWFYQNVFLSLFHSQKHI